VRLSTPLACWPRAASSAAGSRMNFEHYADISIMDSVRCLEPLEELTAAGGRYIHVVQFEGSIGNESEEEPRGNACQTEKQTYCRTPAALALGESVTWYRAW
jgi:hypothetical protein